MSWNMEMRWPNLQHLDMSWLISRSSGSSGDELTHLEMRWLIWRDGVTPLEMRGLIFRWDDSSKDDVANFNMSWLIWRWRGSSLLQMRWLTWRWGGTSRDVLFHLEIKWLISSYRGSSGDKVAQWVYEMSQWRSYGSLGCKGYFSCPGFESDNLVTSEKLFF